jgi:hypothetical protein
LAEGSAALPAVAVGPSKKKWRAWRRKAPRLSNSIAKEAIMLSRQSALTIFALITTFFATSIAVAQTTDHPPAMNDQTSIVHIPLKEFMTSGLPNILPQVFVYNDSGKLLAYATGQNDWQSVLVNARKKKEKRQHDASLNKKGAIIKRILVTHGHKQFPENTGANVNVIVMIQPSSGLGDCVYCDRAEGFFKAHHNIRVIHVKMTNHQ